VYCEYQNTRNPGGGLGTPPYNYSMQWGDIGFFVLDVRGARDYERGELLGAEQWRSVTSFLEEADDIETLFVVTSLPVAHVARWMTYVFDRLPTHGGDQVRDRWSAAAFADERDALLGELFGWQRKRASRQVVLLSGDVHAASAFTIRERGGPGQIQQFTSSALTTPHTAVQRLLNTLAVRAPNLFENRFSFRQHFLSFANNYGLLRVQPLAAGGHRVSLAIRSWEQKTRTLKTTGRVDCEPDSPLREEPADSREMQ
jgi:alkaline phosphatase D